VRQKSAVAGANGFVGKNLVNRLVARGDEVVAIYNRDHSNIPVGCQNLSSADLPPDLKVDVLYISVGNYSLDPPGFRAQHLLIAKLLNTISFNKVVLVSSVSVYGNPAGPIDSHSPFAPASLYGFAKLADEFLVRTCPNFSIVRFTYLYGRGMGTNSLLPRWVEQAAKGELIVFGKGERVQDYLHIDDAIALLIHAAEQSGNVEWIGATGHSVSNAELARLISACFPGSEIRFQGSDNSPSFRFVPGHTGSWKAQSSIAEGISKYCSDEMADL
jgi:UDP-glucose 4-epimerase